MNLYIIRYGTMAGILLAIELFVTFVLIKGGSDGTDMGTSMLVGYSLMVLCLGIAMVLAMLRFQKEQVYNVGKAIAICMGMAIIGSLFYLGAWAIIYNYFLTDFDAKMLNMLQKEFDAGRMTLETYNEYKTSMQNYSSPSVFIPYTLIEIVPVGIGLGLLVPGIFWAKNRKKTTQAAV